jgi:nucleotide-binding universal stress UspA family protein
MKKILVPCDFSQPAVNAFRFALDVAAESKGTVYLLNVLEVPVINDPVIMPVMTFEQDFLKDLKNKATAEFSKLTAKYSHDDVKVVPVVEFGSPARAIVEYAGKNAVDLIIMGSHGASGLREFFVGSNAEKVVRHSTVPVLVMKNYHKGPVRNIIFPNTLDMENLQDLTMKVKALQSFFRAKIHIVYINTPVNFASDIVTYPRLREFAGRFMFKDYTLNVFNHPSEEEGIIHFTESVKGDLIAMGTHGRKGISHMINGSLAEDIVNHTDCAIWTYNLTQQDNQLYVNPGSNH